MTSGAQAGDSRFIEVSLVLPGCSHQFQSHLLAPPGNSIRHPGVLDDENNDAQDDSWRGCFMVSLLGNKVFPHEGWMWMG
jgi:hypothetical protein